MSKQESRRLKRSCVSSRLKVAVAADGYVWRGGSGPPRPRARAAVAVLLRAPGTTRRGALEVRVVLRGTFWRAPGGKEGGILLQSGEEEEER